MAEPLAGKVAFITGAGHGQGRAHALTLASRGAKVVALDICEDVPSCPYPLSTEEELAETVALVEKEGSEGLAIRADVRDLGAMEEAMATALDRFGRVDIVVANAGISAMRIPEHPDAWNEVIDINLKGAFHAAHVAIPQMIERGEGGCIVLTGSTAALTSGYGYSPCALAYGAAKHGIVALMRAYAANLGQYNIRVNAVHPSAVATSMAQSEDVAAYIAEVRANPGTPSGQHALPVMHLDPQDIANAVAFLCSDDARYITGVNLPVDAGYSN